MQNINKRDIDDDTLYTPPVVVDSEQQGREGSIDDIKKNMLRPTEGDAPAQQKPDSSAYRNMLRPEKDDSESYTLPQESRAQIIEAQKRNKEFLKKRQEAINELTDLYGDDFFASLPEKKKNLEIINREIDQLKDRVSEISTEETARKESALTDAYSLYSTSHMHGDALIKDISKRHDKQRDAKISEANERIKELTAEKRRLEYELNPVSAHEIKAFKAAGVGIYGSVYGEPGKTLQKSADLIADYGIDRYYKIYDQSVTNDLDMIQKSRLNITGPDGRSDINKVFSWTNIMHGEKEELKYIDEKELTKLWESINYNEGFWKKGNKIDKKLQVIDKEVRDYVAKTEYENKEAVYNNIISNLVPRLIANPDGSLSPEGLKLFGKWLEERADLLETWISTSNPFTAISGGGKTPFMQGMKKSDFARLSAQHGRENVQAWMDLQNRDIRGLANTRRLIEDIKNLPEQRGGFHDIWKGAQSSLASSPDKAIKYLSFGVIKAMFDKPYTQQITRKSANDEPITPGEKMFLQGLATMNSIAGQGTQGNVFQASESILNMIPYMMQFYGSGAAYTMTHQAFIKGVNPASRKMLSKVLGAGAGIKTADVATKWGARLTGAFAQTLAVPQMTVENVYDNLLRDATLSDQTGEMLAVIDKNSPMSVGKAVKRGLTSSYLEFLFERSGEMMFRKAAGLKKMIRGTDTYKNAAKSKFLQGYMKLKGITRVEDLRRYVDAHKLGWSGIWEEYLEELGTYMSEKILFREKVFDENFWNEQYITFLTVAGFGGIMGATKTIRSYSMGTDVKYVMARTVDGKEQKTEVTLPFDVHRDLMKALTHAFGSEAIVNHQALQDFFEKHKDRFTTKGQLDLINHLTDKFGEARLKEYIKKQGSKQTQPKEPAPETASTEETAPAAETASTAETTPGTTVVTSEEVEPGFNPDIILDPEESDRLAMRPNISTEERAEIEKENKRIIEDHPDMAKANLLVMDEATGSYLPVTREYIEELYNQKQLEYKQRVEYGEDGRVTNERQLRSLKEQIGILEKYMEKYVNMTTPFEKLSPHNKQRRLIVEIKDGEKLIGSMSRISDRAFQIKLRDGRTIVGFYNMDLKPSEVEELNKAILNNEEVELIYQDFTEWNPDLMYFNKDTGIPYYDRIGVKFRDKVDSDGNVVSEGKIIGSVQITDFTKKPGTKGEEKKRKKKESAISKTIDESVKKSVEDARAKAEAALEDAADAAEEFSEEEIAKREAAAKAAEEQRKSAQEKKKRIDEKKKNLPDTVEELEDALSKLKDKVNRRIREIQKKARGYLEEQDHHDKLKDGQTIPKHIAVGKKYDPDIDAEVTIKKRTPKGFRGKPYQMVTRVKKPTIMTDGVKTQSAVLEVSEFESRKAGLEWLDKQQKSDDKKRERDASALFEDTSEDSDIINEKIQELRAKEIAERPSVVEDKPIKGDIGLRVVSPTKAPILQEDHAQKEENRKKAKAARARAKEKFDQKIAELETNLTNGKPHEPALKDLHNKVGELFNLSQVTEDADERRKINSNLARQQRRATVISSAFKEAYNDYRAELDKIEEKWGDRPPTQNLDMVDNIKTGGVDSTVSKSQKRAATTFMLKHLRILGLAAEKQYSIAEVLPVLGEIENRTLKDIFDMFFDIFQKTETKIVFTAKAIEGAEDGKLGLYDMTTNSITISIANIAQNYAASQATSTPITNITDYLARTVMHEVSHGFTAMKVGIFKLIDSVNEVRQRAELREEGLTSEEIAFLETASEVIGTLTQDEIDALEGLNEVYESFIRDVPEDIREFYGFRNLAEFIAEAMSNPTFINYLKGIPGIRYDHIAGRFKKASVFQRFLEWLMQLFGITKNHNMHNYVLGMIYDIGYFYNPHTEEPLHQLYNEVVETMIGLNVNFTYGDKLFIEDQITNDNFKEVAQNFIDSVSNMASDIEPGYELDIIRASIDHTKDLSFNDKQILHEYLNANTDKIMLMIQALRNQEMGLIQGYKPPSVDELVMIANSESINPSGAEKLNRMLGSFSPLWRAIADDINSKSKTRVSRGAVERAFYNLAKQDGIEARLQNQATYNQFIESLRGIDEIHEGIADVLEKTTLSSAVSLFDFYTNITLTRQYKYTIRGNKLVRELINPSEKYNEFVDRFWTTLASYRFVDPRTQEEYEGFDAIAMRLALHDDKKRNQRFKIQNITEYLERPPEEREKLRRLQHEEDVMFLSEITGIPIDVWNEYFSRKTKETMALSQPNSDTAADFMTYDNLLAHDTWRKGKAKTYVRIESNLMFNLSFQLIGKTGKEFENALVKFFLHGSEDGVTLSNIYKLTTSIEKTEDVGFRGRDVKGDGISAFVQSSNMSDIAHSIRESWTNNHITRWYIKQGRDAEIVYLNGIQSEKSRNKMTGFENENMSSSDFWLTQMMLFLEGEGSYLHWIGQFGDKTSIQLMEVPKYADKEITEKSIEALKKQFPDFEEAVTEFRYKIIEPNIRFFNDYLPSTKDVPKDQIYDLLDNAKNKMARDFLYNFAGNIDATNKIFFGSYDNYDNSLVKMVKRAGSTNSPGWKMNRYIEGGVGQTYQFAIVNDELGKLEIHDGHEFVSGDYARRMQVSMGEKFSRVNDPEYQKLSSAKVLTSFVNELGLRGLTKTNRLNIDMLADALGGMYEDIREFMKTHNIDVLSFRSGTKMYEKEGGRKGNMVDLWDSEGKRLKKAIIPENAITTRSNANVYVQQDLRHSSTPKTASMSSQLHANMMILDNGTAISQYIHKLQDMVVSDFMKAFKEGNLSKMKETWMKEHLTGPANIEVKRLLDAGVNIYEPVFMQYFRTSIANYVKAKALELPINRVTTQEVLDASRSLKQREKYIHTDPNTGKVTEHLLHPEINANIEGARYANRQFEGKPGAAISYIEANKSEHLDLYRNGKLQEWEIYGRNGIIPGELIISTRVPADDLHSHTVARLNIKLTGTNFTMLDFESHQSSGSDADGDQRYNQTFYRYKGEDSKIGKIILNDSREGVANKIMLMIADDYSNPKFEQRIKQPIETKKYKEMLGEDMTESKPSDFFDWRAYDRARNDNLNGVKMKGILTDVVTIYGILSPQRIVFRNQIDIPYQNRKDGSWKSITLAGFASDPEGYLKSNLVNFLNLAFDNANDPQLELMGYNEITAYMWSLVLLGNTSLDTTNDAAIMDYIKDVKNYFTSDMMKDFVETVRNARGAFTTVDEYTAIGNFVSRYEEADTKVQIAAKAIVALYYRSKELSKIERFYDMTKNIPTSAASFIYSRMLYDQIARNDEEAFKLINVRPLFSVVGTEYVPATEFRISRKTIDIAENIIHSDSFMMSKAAQRMLNQIKILTGIKEGKEILFSDLEAIERIINRHAIISALGTQTQKRTVEVELKKKLNDLKHEFPENSFLRALHITPINSRLTVALDPNMRHSGISEDILEVMRQDFNLLYQSDDTRLVALANKFAFHTVNRFGVTSSTNNGSFYSLLSDEIRVDMSMAVEEELKKWQNDELSPIDMALAYIDIVRHVYPNEFRKGAFEPVREYTSWYKGTETSSDINRVSMEALDEIMKVKTPEDLVNIATAFEINLESLYNFINDRYRMPGKAMQAHFFPAIKRFVNETSDLKAIDQEFKKFAHELFPAKPLPPAETPKNMLPSDAVHEVLMTEDPALQEFIFSNLAKRYPGIVFFTDRDAFIDFVNKHGGAGYDVSLNAIGMSFRNAVYIDPSRAVQSTIIHEHAHIYWDALPEDHEVKRQLMDLYQQQFSWFTPEQAEEQAILDIGRAGTDIAHVMFSGSAMQKFVEYLKAFWRAVKIHILKNAKQADLVRQFAWDVWNNAAGINSSNISTRMGEFQVKNMIQPSKAFMSRLSLDKGSHTYNMHGETTPIAGVSSVKEMFAPPFDSKGSAAAATIKYNKQIGRLTGKTPTLKDSQELVDAIEQRFANVYAEAGTVVHAIFEAYHAREYVTPEMIERFADPMLTGKIMSIAHDFWEHVFGLFPDATLDTTWSELMLASQKTLIAGTADIVIDTGRKDADGNNLIWIFDIKTTKEHLADDQSQPLANYKAPFGLYRAPFQALMNSKYTAHMVQTNMYANIIEEYKDPKTGVGNVVEAIRILPIVIDIDSEGLITKVQESNWAIMPRTARIKEVTTQMMEMSYAQRKNLEEIFDKYADILKEKKYPAKIRHDMLQAMHFISMTAGDPRMLTKHHIDNIRSRGIKSTYAVLLKEYQEYTEGEKKGLMTDDSGLGYTLRDIHGDSNHAPMTPEELFFVWANKIPRDHYFGYVETNDAGEDVYHPALKDKLFRDKIMYEYLSPQWNPDATPEKWHRYEDKIIEDIGIENVKVGDDLFMIFNVPDGKGGRRNETMHYTVTDVMIDAKRVRVRVEDSFDEIELYVPGKYTGLHKLHLELPKGVNDPGPNSFVPKYLYDLKTKSEKHWHIDIPVAEDRPGSSSYIKGKHLQQLQTFFGQFGNWIAFQDFLDNEVEVQKLWERINAWDDKIFGGFKELIRDELVNHWIARGVRKEYGQFHGVVPPDVLPQTLNLYYLATKDPNALWADFDHGWNGVRMQMPARFHSMKQTPFLMMTSQIFEAVRDQNTEAYEFEKLISEFADIPMDFSKMMTNDNEYWLLPESINKDTHPEEHQFLTILYDYYKRFDPETINDPKSTDRKLIRVSQIHGKANEFINEFGKRFGRTMYEKMKPMAIDAIRLKVVDRFEDGSPVYLVDELTGKPVVRTLGEIKAEFMEGNTTDEEKRKFLGRRYRHAFPFKIPGALASFGKTKAGMLNYYILEARKIVNEGGNENNDASRVKRVGKRIPVIGRGEVVYPTKHFVAAEAEAIHSMIKAHYMRKNMAPLDWMLDMYTEPGSNELRLIGKWLRDWGEYQLYSKKPDMHNQVWHDLVDWVAKMNSMNKIAFSISTQVNNWLIGQALDLIREPGAYVKGFARLHEHAFVSIRKGFNILRRHGVANIVSDTIFDQLDKQYRILRIGTKEFHVDDIENLGYMPMELAEKMNQSIIYIGMMTDAEWNAYDNDGNIKDPEKLEHLSSFRAMVLSNAVQSIHGDYGTLLAAPAWLTVWGKAFWQFKKWLPTMFWFHIAPYHINSNFQINSGLIRTIGLLGKWFKYNVYDVKRKQDAIQKKIEEWNKNPEARPSAQFINSISDYMNTLIEEANGGRITYAMLSESDKRNIRQIAGEILFIATRILLFTGLFIGKDDESYKSDAMKIFLNIMDRWSGDVLWVYNWSEWDYLLASPIPALQIITSGAKTIVDLGRLIFGDERAWYKNESNLAGEGLPKVLISSTYWSPGGSFQRQLIQFARKTNMKMTDFDTYMKNRGIDFNLDKYDKYSGMSYWDVKQGSAEKKSLTKDMNDAALYLKLEAAGIDQRRWHEAVAAIKEIKELKKKYTEAELNKLLKQMIEQDKVELIPGYTLDRKQIEEYAAETRKLEKEAERKPIKGKTRNLEENLDYIKGSRR